MTVSPSTNEEGGEATAAITTVTFEARDGRTFLRMSDLHPTKEALEASGAMDATPETFEQLEELIVSGTVGVPRLLPPSLTNAADS